MQQVRWISHYVNSDMSSSDMASISPFTCPGLRSKKQAQTTNENNDVLGVQGLTLLGEKTNKKPY